MTYRAFEDFHPGETVALGSRSISEAEITAFAQDVSWRSALERVRIAHDGAARR